MSLPDFTFDALMHYQDLVSLPAAERPKVLVNMTFKYKVTSFIQELFTIVDSYSALLEDTPIIMRVSDNRKTKVIDRSYEHHAELNMLFKSKGYDIDVTPNQAIIRVLV
jgi:hypothetical protein